MNVRMYNSAGSRGVRGLSPPPWAYGDSSVKGSRGVDFPEILHIIFFLLALPRFSPLFCPNLGGQLPGPAPLPRTPMNPPPPP